MRSIRGRGSVSQRNSRPSKRAGKIRDAQFSKLWVNRQNKPDIGTRVPVQCLCPSRADLRVMRPEAGVEPMRHECAQSATNSAASAHARGWPRPILRCLLPSGRDGALLHRERAGNGNWEDERGRLSHALTRSEPGSPAVPRSTHQRLTCALYSP